MWTCKSTALDFPDYKQMKDLIVKMRCTIMEKMSHYWNPFQRFSLFLLLWFSLVRQFAQLAIQLPLQMDSFGWVRLLARNTASPVENSLLGNYGSGMLLRFISTPVNLRDVVRQAEPLSTECTVLAERGSAVLTFVHVTWLVLLHCSGYDRVEVLLYYERLFIWISLLMRTFVGFNL